MLTGGACANLYTRGAYQSFDLDFVVQGAAEQSQLDGAMATCGFRRRLNRYEHHEAPFLVEFVRGPLAIGQDLKIEPILLRVRRGVVIALSATDSCRDRLAAFYFWNDRQSLLTAVQIASRQRVNMAAIQRWSHAEGFKASHAEFKRELDRKQGRRARVQS